MEDTLRVFVALLHKKMVLTVLILVLMEDTLRGLAAFIIAIDIHVCLNPCFNGRYSQSAKTCVPLFIVV